MKKNSLIQTALGSADRWWEEVGALFQTVCSLPTTYELILKRFASKFSYKSICDESLKVSIGSSYAQEKNEGDSVAKPSNLEINSEENKIPTDDGPSSFKFNSKRMKPHKLPFIEIDKTIKNHDDQKSVWDVYNNEKSSKTEGQNSDVDEEVDSASTEEISDTPSSENASTSSPKEQITSHPESTANLKKLQIKPLQQSTIIYFYKPLNSLKTPKSSPASLNDVKNDKLIENHEGFSSLGFGYPFLQDIFSLPRDTNKRNNVAKIHFTIQDHKDDQNDKNHHGFSSLGFGYPFIKNIYSLPGEGNVKNKNENVRFAKGNEVDELKDGSDASSTKSDFKSDVKHVNLANNRDHGIQQEQNNKNDENSSNVEDILSTILPVYEWATRRFIDNFDIDMNPDILNIGNILFRNLLSPPTDDKKDKFESLKPRQPAPSITLNIGRNHENYTPRPQSFIDEVMDHITSSSKNSENREINIERPPTDKDVFDIESEGSGKKTPTPRSAPKDVFDIESKGSEKKTPIPRSAPKCICGFSQGKTNSCTCFPQELYYYQYCSVPIPPTD